MQAILFIMIIWLASYPKSGNTWIRSFLSAYYFTDDGLFKFNLLEKFKQFPSKDFINKKLNDPGKIIDYWHPIQEKLLQDKNIKFIKTHNALVSLNNIKFTTPKYTLGAIYIIRDPRNLITSLKDHTDISYEEALKFMTDKDTILYDIDSGDYDATHFIGSWSDHYKSWTNNSDFKTIVIRYEDLEENCENVFRDLIYFINGLLRTNDNIDEKKFQNSMKTTSFSNLRNLEDKGEFNENVVSLKTNNKVKFFNLGFKNKWQKILSGDMKLNINEKFKSDIEILKY